MGGEVLLRIGEGNEAIFLVELRLMGDPDDPLASCFYATESTLTAREFYILVELAVKGFLEQDRAP